MHFTPSPHLCFSSYIFLPQDEHFLLSFLCDPVSHYQEQEQRVECQGKSPSIVRRYTIPSSTLLYSARNAAFQDSVGNCLSCRSNGKEQVCTMYALTQLKVKTGWKIKNEGANGRREKEYIVKMKEKFLLYK